VRILHINVKIYAATAPTKRHDKLAPFGGAMAERLEMVVSGKRRPAMPSAPEFVSRISPTSGFGVEAHLLSDTFELPDHWIPFYLVGCNSPAGN
jgi:hypothetical protein